MPMKIAMLFPYSPSYRTAIYKLIDEQLDVEWFFCGNAQRNLKLMDYSLLRKCNLSMEERHILGPVTYYRGMKHLQLQNYDVIICPGVIRSITEWWLLQKFGKRMKHTKVFLWTHGWYGRETFIQKIIKKIFFRRVDGIFLYGEYARNLMIEEGFKADKLHVIKNSLDYNKQLILRNGSLLSDIYTNHFKNDYPTIIFIGRLTQEKKLEQLIRAVSILKQKKEYYNIVFVGNGTMRESLTSEVSKYGLENNVWFYGECFDERKNAELIYNADLCVSPGNIGLTAVHTLMFGCPAISHSSYKWQGPEFEAIIPGKTGDFFECDNVADLSRCISKWFTNGQDDRDAIRKSCYEEIDKHWNPHYQINLIKKVLGIQ